MSKTWLNSLLRARQAQEDVAKQHLASAQRASHRADAQARAERRRLETLRLDESSAYSTSAFVAAAVALQAAAATHAAAVSAAEESQLAVAEQRDVLGDAARARRTAEELYERDRADASDRLRRAAQRELDEFASRGSRDQAETS